MFVYYTLEKKSGKNKKIVITIYSNILKNHESLKNRKFKKVCIRAYQKSFWDNEIFKQNNAGQVTDNATKLKYTNYSKNINGCPSFIQNFLI